MTIIAFGLFFLGCLQNWVILDEFDRDQEQQFSTPIRLWLALFWPLFMLIAVGVWLFYRLKDVWERR